MHETLNVFVKGGAVTEPPGRRGKRTATLRTVRTRERESGLGQLNVELARRVQIALYVRSLLPAPQIRLLLTTSSLVCCILLGSAPSLRLLNNLLRDALR